MAKSIFDDDYKWRFVNSTSKHPNDSNLSVIKRFVIQDYTTSPML